MLQKTSLATPTTLSEKAVRENLKTINDKLEVLRSTNRQAAKSSSGTPSGLLARK